MNVQEIIDTSHQLISERVEWDKVWSQMARLVLPMQDREFRNGVADGSSREKVEGWARGPTSVDRIGERFDITGIIAADRLATGLISLITPDSEKWMGLGGMGSFGAMELNDEEARWSERQRDYLLSTMYTPLTGWTQANGAAFRSMVVFGTGLYFLEEAYGKRGKNDVSVPYTFSPLPLSENYLTVDGQNELDGDYRRFRMSARQAAGVFGTGLSAKTQALAGDPQKCHQQIDFCHWIGYRQEKGLRADPLRASPVESVYVEVEHKHEVKRGGFSYWPVVAYQWNQVPHSPYSESPVMLVLGEIKSANIHGKNSLLSSQQLTAPPVAVGWDEGNKPNLNPRAINYGAIDAQGRLKIQPIFTAQNPSLVQEVLEASRMQIREGLYTNLWQILIQNPNMTATEALIRANEKGELLGPVGTKVQAGLAQCVDGQLTIIAGKGAWTPGALLEPPQSLAGKDVRPIFSSPLDRLRRSSELVGIQRTIEVLTPLAQLKPEIMDRIDDDEVVRIAQEVTGAPKRMLRPDKDVEAMRAARQQQQQVQSTIDTAGQAGAAIQQAVPAAQQIGALLDQA